MSTTTLLPCPFCGREARISHSGDGELCNIRCTGWNPGDCLGAGPNCYSVDEAVAGWNRRGAAAAPEVLPEPDAWRDGARFALEVVSKVDSICWLTDSMKVICIKNAADAVIAERDRQRALLATATGLPAQAVEPHPDDVAVDALAALMKAKLAKQRDKGYGGWDTDCTQQRLSELLRDHVEKGDPVDVANFCAFLSMRGEGIATHAQADARDAVTQAVRDYYFALDTRQHGGAAASTALDAIQKALGLNWVQGVEASARAAIAAAKGE